MAGPGLATESLLVLRPPWTRPCMASGRAPGGVPYARPALRPAGSGGPSCRLRAYWDLPGGSAGPGTPYGSAGAPMPARFCSGPSPAALEWRPEAGPRLPCPTSGPMAHGVEDDGARGYPLGARAVPPGEGRCPGFRVPWFRPSLTRPARGSSYVRSADIYCPEPRMQCPTRIRSYG